MLQGSVIQPFSSEETSEIAMNILHILNGETSTFYNIFSEHFKSFE